MKNMKRAWRRHKQWCVFKKRLKLWGVWDNTEHVQDLWCPGCYPYQPWGTRESALRGETHTFLKDTSTPCSCYMCSYPKYERPPKHKIQKEMWDEVLENLDIIGDVL